MMHYLSADEIAYIHARIVQISGGLPGVRDNVTFAAIPTRIRMTHRGQEYYNDLFTKAAVLMKLIVDQKPFHDGNKRAGLGASTIFLRRNGQDLIAPAGEVVEFCRSVEDGAVTEVEMADWFKSHTAQLAAT